MTDERYEELLREATASTHAGTERVNRLLNECREELTEPQRELFYLALIQADGKNLGYLREDEQTPKLCAIAVEVYPNAILFVKNEELQESIRRAYKLLDQRLPDDYMRPSDFARMERELANRILGDNHV